MWGLDRVMMTQGTWHALCAATVEFVELVEVIVRRVDTAALKGWRLINCRVWQ